MGLAGLAHGFAQGAMPVPYKGGVPFGATLGFAAGDASQGAQNAYAAQQAYNQAEGGRLALQQAQAMQPYSLHLIKAMQGIGIPGTASQTASAAPLSTSTGPGPIGGAADITKNALSSLPSDSTRGMAINAALSAGLPMEAWAPWMATVDHESGWNPQVSDGTHGEIGPGQVLPSTGQLIGYTPQQLRDPQTNLIVSAKYFGQQWQQGRGDPAYAAGHYNAGPNGQPNPEYVNPVMQRLASWAGAGGGNLSPQDAQARADQLYQQANTLETQQNMAKQMQARGFMMPLPPGDPQAIRQRAAQFQETALAGPKKAAETANTVTIDRRSGTVLLGTRVLGKTSELHAVQGPDGYYHMIAVGGTGQFAENYTPQQIMAAPIVKPTELTEADIEQAKEIGARAGIVPSIPQPGVMQGAVQPSAAPAAGPAPSGGKPYLMPNGQPVLGPDGNPIMGNGAPLPGSSRPQTWPDGTPIGIGGGQVQGGAAPAIGAANAAAPIPSVANATQLAPGVTARPSPGGGTAITNRNEAQEDAYKSELPELQKSTDEINFLGNGQTRNLEILNLAKQAPGTGFGGTVRLGIANAAQSLLPASQFQQWIKRTAGFDNVQAAQELQKLNLTSAGTQEREAVGARGGVKLTEMFAKANPGLDLLQGTNEDIARFNSVIGQYTIDYLKGEHQWLADHGYAYANQGKDYVSVSQYDNAWSQMRNPQVYLAAAEITQGIPYEKWSNGLSVEEKQRALSIVKNIDPTTQVPWKGNQMMNFNASRP